MMTHSVHLYFDTVDVLVPARLELTAKLRGFMPCGTITAKKQIRKRLSGI